MGARDRPGAANEHRTGARSIEGGTMRDGTRDAGIGRKILAASAVPASVVACVLLADAMMDAGIAPAAAVLPMGAVMLGVVALLERVLPWHRDWLSSRGDLAVDALYLPTQAVVTSLLRPVAASLTVAASVPLSRLVPGGPWPDDWPIVAQVVLASLVRELFDYWAHRAMHEIPWLWRLHATHHSATRLYWLNGARAHPLEIALRFGLVGVLPLAILGVDPRVLALTSAAALAADSFQHANIALRLGPLAWIYSIGDAHRWHHSLRREEADANYGNVYLVWDAVFGTRYLPADREPPTEVGIEGLEAFPKGFFDQWLSPWRWSRILAESGARDGGDPAHACDAAPAR
jgi:sterol desaturase/sphingolipid hydroxylase (fatty acid hydroxylase superfamily)